MKNIYIATPVDMGNYGNRLQNFAVHRICEQMGMHPITLAVDNDKKYHSLISRHVILKFLSKINFEKTAVCKHRFNSMFKSLKSWKFTKDWIETKYVPKSFDPKSLPAGSYVGIGGDQMWSPYWHNAVPFCNFEGLDPNKKICFAPSFGSDTLPEEYEEIVSKELATIAFPGVREASGVEIIARLTGKQASIVADPVLGLSKEEWKKYIDGDKTPVPGKRYIFSYLLGKASDKRKEWIQKEASEYGFHIVDMTGNISGNKTIVSPLGFVKLISNAEYVLTDSFHAILFSLIFGRPIVICKRDGGEKMNTRIQNIIGTFSIDNCWFDDAKELFEYQYDALKIEKMIGQCREEAFSYYNRIVGADDGNNPLCFKAYATDDSVRLASSSGGLFYTLAVSVLREDGCVIGAEMEQDGQVYLKTAWNDEQLKRFRGSKYVQANVGKIYQEVEDCLRKGKMILFSGTPCQCNALHAYLGKDYDNLYIIDLICHGVPTHGVWQKYFNSLNREKKVVDVNFRDKREGWNNFGLAIRYEDGTENFTQKANENYLQFFSWNFSLRPSCYKCRSKGNNRATDITLADFWGLKGDDVEKGCSACIVHTDKGLRLLQSVSEKVVTTKVQLDAIVLKNRNYLTSVGKPLKRNLFFKDLKKGKPVFENLHKYIKVSFWERVVHHVIKKLMAHRIDNTTNYIQALRFQNHTEKYKDNCCGCAACYNACPKGAIKMELDEEGALYPVFQSDLCINCGKCEEVCYKPW